MTRRNEFSRQTKNAAFDRSKRGGDVAICECDRVPALGRPAGCGAVLRSGNVFYEHIHQDALGGSSDLDNCAALSKTCWSEKTATIDLPVIAKANRRRDRDRGSMTLPWRPMVGTRRSGIRKPLHPHARPVDRRTGHEL
jgi:hypothetical protein